MKTLLAILLALPALASAEVYKCAGNVYQSTPCGGASIAVPVRPPAPKVVVARPGMSEADMIASMDRGRPIMRINVSESAAGISKQFVIGRHVGSQSYIYTVNGVVTGVQW